MFSSIRMIFAVLLITGIAGAGMYVMKLRADNATLKANQIKLVKEIVSTGGVLSSISIAETSKDYLTPDEWHEEMKQLTNQPSNDTILIDCRNHKEFAVGHFDSAIDPNTKIFAQFPRWVQENKSALKDKKVLMYCTGGIRCEKASALVRFKLLQA